MNLQELLPSYTIKELVEVINYNFDQLLLNGGGIQGVAGIQGPIGPLGPTGTRGSLWYMGESTPDMLSLVNLKNNDCYLQSNGNVWTYNAISNEWINSNINIKGEAGENGDSVLLPGGNYNLTNIYSYYYITNNPDLYGASSGEFNNNNAVFDNNAVLIGGYPGSAGGYFSISDEYSNNIDGSKGSLFVHTISPGIPNIVLSTEGYDDITKMSNILVGDKNILYILSNRTLTDNTPLGINIRTVDSDIKLESSRDIFIETVGEPSTNKLDAMDGTVGNITIQSNDISTSLNKGYKNSNKLHLINLYSDIVNNISIPKGKTEILLTGEDAARKIELNKYRYYNSALIKSSNIIIDIDDSIKNLTYNKVIIDNINNSTDIKDFVVNTFNGRTAIGYDFTNDAKGLKIGKVINANLDIDDGVRLLHIKNTVPTITKNNYFNINEIIINSALEDVYTVQIGYLSKIDCNIVAGGNFNTHLIGFKSNIRNYLTCNAKTITGFSNEIATESTNALSDITGFNSNIYINANSAGVINRIYGINNIINGNAQQTIGSTYGIYSEINHEHETTSSNNFLLYLKYGKVTNSVNYFGLYQDNNSGDVRNILKSPLCIGYNLDLSSLDSASLVINKIELNDLSTNIKLIYNNTSSLSFYNSDNNIVSKLFISNENNNINKTKITNFTSAFKYDNNTLDTNPVLQDRLNLDFIDGRIIFNNYKNIDETGTPLTNVRYSDFKNSIQIQANKSIYNSYENNGISNSSVNNTLFEDGIAFWNLPDSTYDNINVLTTIPKKNINITSIFNVNGSNYNKNSLNFESKYVSNVLRRQVFDIRLTKTTDDNDNKNYTTNLKFLLTDFGQLFIGENIDYGHLGSDYRIDTERSSWLGQSSQLVVMPRQFNNIDLNQIEQTITLLAAKDNGTYNRDAAGMGLNSIIYRDINAVNVTLSGKMIYNTDRMDFKSTLLDGSEANYTESTTSKAKASFIFDRNLKNTHLQLGEDPTGYGAATGSIVINNRGFNSTDYTGDEYDYRIIDIKDENIYRKIKGYKHIKIVEITDVDPDGVAYPILIIPNFHNAINTYNSKSTFLKANIKIRYHLVISGIGGGNEFREYKIINDNGWENESNNPCYLKLKYGNFSSDITRMYSKTNGSDGIIILDEDTGEIINSTSYANIYIENKPTAFDTLYVWFNIPNPPLNTTSIQITNIHLEYDLETI